MKKTGINKIPLHQDDLKQEYCFDYHNAKPNRFSGQSDEKRVVVVLDPDVSEFFSTPDSVNRVLRALVKTMPAKAAVSHKHQKVV